MMRLTDVQSRPSPEIIGIFSIVTVVVTVLGWAVDYSFFPDGSNDGFFSQINYANKLVRNQHWEVLSKDPLMIVHLIRFAVAWPFFTLEHWFGSAGPLLLLCILLSPLLMSFQAQTIGWKSSILFASRLVILFTPLFVSGRTVLVIVGMGYLVAGIMMRPFSFSRMTFGCLLGVLSSASLLFSLVILLVAGNWHNRSQRFYVAKATMVVFVGLLLSPSLVAKFHGFSSGSKGYEITETQPSTYDDNEAIDQINPAANTDRTQPMTNNHLLGNADQSHVPLLTRILGRATVVQSYVDGSVTKLFIYGLLFGSAVLFVAVSLVRRKWNPLLIVLVVLSTGVFLEGLSLWPILLPLVWAYTGSIVPAKALASSNKDTFS